MWFHNNKVNEVLLGFYRLHQKQAILQGSFQERQVTSSDLKNLLFEYSNIRPINEKIDHITCHADGRFHIKTIGGREVYRETMRRAEPLGPDTSTFLEFIVVTHLSERYRMITTKPHEREVFIDHLDSHIFIIEGRFSGAKYAGLENEVLGRLQQIGARATPAFRLNGSTIRGILTLHPLKMAPETLVDRPEGTIIILRFPIGLDRFMIKGFSIG